MALATLLAGKSIAQSSVDAAIAVSNGHLADNAYDDARREVFQSLRANPSAADRDRLLDQLDRINAAVPYFFSIGYHLEFTSGTRRTSGRPPQLAWCAALYRRHAEGAGLSASLRSTVDLDFGYVFDFSPDVDLTVGVDGSIYYYEETTFMEAWLFEPYVELDVNLGPILANTHLAMASRPRAGRRSTSTRTSRGLPAPTI